MSAAFETELAARTSFDLDVDIRTLKLDVRDKKIRGLDKRIDDSLTDGSIERTMDGASTLTLVLHDPRRTLLNSGMLEHTIDTTLDALRWRLVKVSKSEDQLTLTFEDLQVALLRTHTSVRKAPRSKMTRAEFALSLVRELKPPVPFISPSLHVTQAVAAPEEDVDPSAPKGKKKKKKTTPQTLLPFQFQRGGTDGEVEDSWSCLQRLAEEVQWRCFVSGGAVYFISETDLLKQAPVATLSEDTLGVSGIDFDIDNGKADSEATVTCRTSRWFAPPGSVVRLEKCGPANGLWLVNDVMRGVYDTEATITLKRETKPLPEPAAELADTFDGSSGDFAVTNVNSCWEAAQAIHAKRFPYVWGGGHGACGVPSGGIKGGHGGGIGLIGFDCSGSTCAVLAGGSLGFEPGGGVMDSGSIARSWGKPGRGQALTVYANSEHVFIVFHTKGGDRHFGTGDWGKGWDGPGFNPNMHTLDGFTAKHWPGS